MKSTMKVMDPPRERTVTDKMWCDICKKVAVRPDADSPFTNEPYAVEKVTVEAEEGTSYPSGGNKDMISFDICHACFISKVVPALAALGAQPTKSNSDW